MSIGQVLRAERRKMGLTVAQAASLGGVTRSYLSMVETGQRAPNPEVLVRFTQALQIPADAWLSAFLSDERRCQRLVGLGGALFQAGNYTAARRASARALLVSRTDHDGRYNSEIYLLLGRVRYAEGRYRQALRWFSRLTRAVRHSQDGYLHGIAAFNLAQSLARTGRELDALAKFDEATQAFRAVRMWPRLGLVWLARANLLLTRSMYRDSQGAYRKAAHLLRGKPFHDDALLGVAITTIVVQGPAASVPLLRKIIDNERTDVIVRAKARDNLAMALREIGSYPEAVSQVRCALKTRDRLPPRLVAALLAEEALCYARMGDLASARRAMDEYKAIAGEKDDQDVAAMGILARVLEVEPPQEQLSGAVADDHEHHMSEALRILQAAPSRPKENIAQRRKEVPSVELAP